MREDKIRTKYVRKNVAVALIVDEMRENRLRWFVLTSTNLLTKRKEKEENWNDKTDKKWTLRKDEEEENWKRGGGIQWEWYEDVNDLSRRSYQLEI